MKEDVTLCKRKVLKEIKEKESERKRRK